MALVVVTAAMGRATVPSPGGRGTLSCRGSGVGTTVGVATAEGDVAGCSKGET